MAEGVSHKGWKLLFEINLFYVTTTHPETMPKHVWLWGSLRKFFEVKKWAFSSHHHKEPGCWHCISVNYNHSTTWIVVILRKATLGNFRMFFLRPKKTCVILRKNCHQLMKNIESPLDIPRILALPLMTVSHFAAGYFIPSFLFASEIREAKVGWSQLTTHVILHLHVSTPHFRLKMLHLFWCYFSTGSRLCTWKRWHKWDCSLAASIPP